MHGLRLLIALIGVKMDDFLILCSVIHVLHLDSILDDFTLDHVVWIEYCWIHVWK